jgi:subtilisin family serine protease
MISRPIFEETVGDDQVPAASHEELARAIMECVDAGARVINLSVGTRPSTATHPRLLECLDYAARRDTLVVAAAGNHATLGSSAITRHPWVIPVVACDARGRPARASNLGASIGRRGLCAPGEDVESFGVDGAPRTFTGTSVAAPFVTGTIALLWSEFPRASAVQIRRALTDRHRRRAVTPPLLDAVAAWEYMGGMVSGSRRDGTGTGRRAR